MENKTKQVDRILTEIVADLKAGKLPSVENSVALEALQWNYKESTNKNLASDLGLRTRVESKDPRDYKSIPQEFLTAFLHQSPIDKFDIDSYINTIEAYLGRKITVAKLFGERYRKDRNNISGYERDFWGDLVEITLKEIPGLNSSNSNVFSVKNNVFQLLEDITNESIKIETILKRHSVVNKFQLIKIKSLIVDEFNFGKIKKRLISKNTFQTSYSKID